MAEPIHFIIYFSKAAKLMTTTELQFLLEQSRHNNLVNHITGMLLYLEGRFLTNVEGRFMQFFEGPAAEIESLFAAIKADDRHSKLIVLKDGTIDERLFDSWSMGFRLISTDKKENIPGFFHVDAQFLDQHIVDNRHEILNFFRSFYTINNEGHL